MGVGAGRLRRRRHVDSAWGGRADRRGGRPGRVADHEACRLSLASAARAARALRVLAPRWPTALLPKLAWRRSFPARERLWDGALGAQPGDDRRHEDAGLPRVQQSRQRLALYAAW